MGVGLAVILSLIFISSVVAKVGLIAGAIVLSVVLLFGAWLYDKREARKDREFGD